MICRVLRSPDQNTGGNKPTPDVGRTGGETRKPDPDALNKDLAGIQPTGPGDNAPATGQLPGAAAKAAGAGLEPGSTDFGPSNASISGGRGGVGSDSSRTTTAGTGGSDVSPAGGSAGPGGAGADVGTRAAGHGGAAAGGNSVTATGRPTNPDNRDPIGMAAVSGHTDPARQQDTSHLQPGGPSRMGGGTTSTGTVGGGTMGTGASGQRDRAEDITTGRRAGPEGALGGVNPNVDPDDPDAPATTNTGTPEAHKAWDRARKQSPPKKG